MVLRNMHGTSDSLAFLGEMEAVTGNAATDWCAGRSSPRTDVLRADVERYSVTIEQKWRRYGLSS